MGAAHDPNTYISQEHLDLISKIYDLPLRPDGWQALLDEFVPLMNAKMAAVTAYDPVYAEHQIAITTSNVGAAFLEEFNSRFSGENPFAKIFTNPKREFVTDLDMHDLDNPEQYLERPAVQWMEKHYGLRHGTASRLNLDRAWTDILCIMYSSDHGQVAGRDMQVGNFFLDHFAKSVELGRAFGVLKNRFNGVLTALDRFHIGIFVLSPNGSVVLKNVEATRLVASGDGLSLSREGQLRPLDEGQRDALKDAIDKAIQTAQSQNNCAETLLTLPRRSGGDAYLVEVAPFRDSDEIDSQFEGCLVFVIDPAKTDMVSTEGMKKLYSLTETESEVCKLVAEGLGTDDMADARGVTRETVRNYVKQILQKTGTRNRAQLVRLALNVNLPIDPA